MTTDERAGPVDPEAPRLDEALPVLPPGPNDLAAAVEAYDRKPSVHTVYGVLDAARAALAAGSPSAPQGGEVDGIPEHLHSDMASTIRGAMGVGASDDDLDWADDVMAALAPLVARALNDAAAAAGSPSPTPPDEGAHGRMWVCYAEYAGVLHLGACTPAEPHGANCCWWYPHPAGVPAVAAPPSEPACDHAATDEACKRCETCGEDYCDCPASPPSEAPQEEKR